ncbi:MAG: hypothetical protein ACTSQY_08195, partial [Candidatus Odinarchaeia archaeon]
MKLLFNYEAKTGLKIINRIDDGEVVWVRGYNGIGKSLAAKMLEIVSGDHIFTSAREYENLRNSLTNLEIIMERTGQPNIKILINPQTWSYNQITNRIDHNSIGKYYVGPDEIHQIDFAKMFKARIISGNESLSTQILALINHSINDFDNLQKNSRQMIDIADKFETKLLDEFELSLLDNYDYNKESAARLEKELRQIQSKLKSFDDILSLLQEIESLNSDFIFHGKYNQQNISKDHQKVNSNIKKTDQEINELIEANVRNNDELKHLMNVEKSSYDSLLITLKNKNHQLEKILSDIFVVSNKIPVEYNPNLRDEDYISSTLSKIENVRDEIKKLVNEEKTIRIDEDVQDKQLRILNIINSSSTGLDVKDQIIAEDRINEIYLSMLDMDNMINNRKEIIDNNVYRKKLKDYEVEKNKLRTNIDIYNNFIDLLNKKKNCIVEIEKIEKTRDSYNVLDQQNYKKIKDKIEEVNGIISKKRIKLSQLYKEKNEYERILDRFESITPKQELYREMEDLKTTLLKEYSIEVKDLEDIKNIIDMYDYDYKLTDSNFNNLMNELLDKQKNIEYTQNNIKREYNKIQTNPEYAYIKNWMNEKKEKDIIKKFITFKNLLSSFIDKVGKFDPNIVNILKYHEELKKLQTQTNPFSGSDAFALIEHIYNKHLKDFYSTDVFMKYVFDEYKKVESFDLQNNEIILLNERNKKITRSFTIFS